MMTESLKLPNMYMTPAGAVYNHLDSGAIQIIHGVRMSHLSGLYERAKEDDFVVNIPTNDMGDFNCMSINQIMALYIDWILVNARIVECWKAHKITSQTLGTADIQTILLRCGIVDVDPAEEVGIVKEAYLYRPPHEVTIDSAIVAVPIHKIEVKTDSEDEE